MTIPVQEALDVEASRVDFAQAARLLCTSRAKLATLILDGTLQQIEQGVLSRADVEQLAERLAPAGGYRARHLRTPKGRLAQVQDRIVWLLHDWGGAGRVSELQAALQRSAQTLAVPLTRLQDLGYVERRSNGWHLTATGWDYTRRFDPPV